MLDRSPTAHTTERINLPILMFLSVLFDSSITNTSLTELKWLNFTFYNYTVLNYYIIWTNAQIILTDKLRSSFRTFVPTSPRHMVDWPNECAARAAASL